jgi:hypothetical protein
METLFEELYSDESNEQEGPDVNCLMVMDQAAGDKIINCQKHKKCKLAKMLQEEQTNLSVFMDSFSDTDLHLEGPPKLKGISPEKLEILGNLKNILDATASDLSYSKSKSSTKKRFNVKFPWFPYLIALLVMLLYLIPNYSSPTKIV